MLTSNYPDREDALRQEQHVYEEKSLKPAADDRFNTDLLKRSCLLSISAFKSRAKTHKNTDITHRVKIQTHV